MNVYNKLKIFNSKKKRLKIFKDVFVQEEVFAKIMPMNIKILVNG